MNGFLKAAKEGDFRGILLRAGTPLRRPNYKTPQDITSQLQKVPTTKCPFQKMSQAIKYPIYKTCQS
jgi:hypothetical protein